MKKLNVFKDRDYKISEVYRETVEDLHSGFRTVVYSGKFQGYFGKSLQGKNSQGNAIGHL